MAVATYTSDLTDICLFETTTGIAAYGGGGAGLGAGVDFAMEGTNAIDKQVTNAEKGFMYDNTSNFTIGANDHFFIWIMGATPGINDTRNNRGVAVCIGDDTSNFVKFHVDGSDTLPLGGGKVYAVRFVNTILSNYRTLVGSPGTTPSWIGGGLNTTGTSKSPNLGVDGARIGSGYDILNGTGADPEATFAGIASDDEGTSEGIFQSAPGGYNLQGKLRMGSSTVTCEFKDLNTNIFLRDSIHSLTDFSEILVENSGSILTLTNVTFVALGTNNKGKLEAVTSAATLAFTGCGFIDFGTTVLGTGSTFTTCRWVGAGIVTANGATLTGSSITGFEGIAGTSPLIWNVATDPDGKLDNMVFEKGTAATHAIEFGTTSPTTMTIRGITFTGYNASNAQNDSTLHIKRTSGTVTINVVDCAGNISYKTDGATVSVVVNPVTLQLTVVKSSDQAVIVGARALVKVSNGNNFPYQASVSITGTGTTATVTHTTHGLATNDNVVIVGANQNVYNGVYQITVSDANTYTYTTNENITVSPATGTITSTMALINGTTNASGVVSDTRTYSVDQAITGWVRMSTSSPYYKQASIADTVDNASGKSINIQMISDE